MANLRRGETQQTTANSVQLRHAGFRLMRALDDYLRAQLDNDAAWEVIATLGQGGYGLSGNIIATEVDEIQVTLIFRTMQGAPSSS